MDSIWGLIALACGLYCLAGYWKMIKKGEVFQSVLLPKEVNLKDCKDTKAYIKEAAPKVLILGIVVTLWGICDLACSSLGIDNLAIFWATFVIVIVVLVWFGITTGKLRKKYFS